MLSNSDNHRINIASATVLINDGRFFSLFESPARQDFLHELRPGWKPITRRQVTESLPLVHGSLLEQVLKLFRAAEYLNIVFDASHNVTSQRIVNLSVKIPDGPAFYWKTFDTADTAHTAEKWVELLMPE